MNHPSSDANDAIIEADDVREMDEVVSELYEVLRQEIPFEDKAYQALELGKQFLNVDNGHLTRIDLETDHWEALVSTDPPQGQFPPGMELDLGTTYCRRVIEEDDQIALHDAPNQGWENDIAYDTHGIRCYLGTSLIIDETTYGTVCFVGEPERGGPFSEIERLFAEFLTQLLERELENEFHESQLTRQTNLSIVLNRVLRHNLRNDLAVIRGYMETMTRNQGDGEFANLALENIDELLELSQKARELDEVVGSESEPTMLDLQAMMYSVVETVEHAYPDATISVECPDDVIIKGLPSLERSIRELVENAAKHAGDAPTIQVSVDFVPNAVEICVTDDGPGMNQQDASVLRTGAETPLLHGSGLGLWLAHWIITSHDGTIELGDIKNGTTLTITIPRQANANMQAQLSKLTRARDQYEAAFEEANDAMVMLNDEAHIVEANALAGDIYGMDEQDLLGQPIPRFLPDDFEFDAAWEQFMNGSLERGTVAKIDANGERRPVEFTAKRDVIPGQHLVIFRPVQDGQANAEV